MWEVGEEAELKLTYLSSPSLFLALFSLLRIFILRRRLRNLEAIWPELRANWTATERRGKPLVVFGEEPVLNESMLELNEEKESLVSSPLLVI